MLLGWSPDSLPLHLAEVMPAGLTHLGLTEDMEEQCTYEWDEELILGELRDFLSVWRSVTPDLQLVEVWVGQEDFSRWKDEEVVQLQTMCEGAGVSCNVYWHSDECSPMPFQWVRQGPQPSYLLPATPPAIEHIYPQWKDEEVMQLTTCEGAGVRQRESRYPRPQWVVECLRPLPATSPATEHANLPRAQW